MVVDANNLELEVEVEVKVRCAEFGTTKASTIELLCIDIEEMLISASAAISVHEKSFNIVIIFCLM